MSTTLPAIESLTLIHTYHTEQALVQVFSNKTTQKIDFFMQKENILHPILTLDTPKFDKMGQDDTKRLLKLHYPLLKEMSDHTYKLYLYPRICGGVIPNIEAAKRMGLHDMHLLDKDVADKIKKDLNETNSYTWIQVNTNMYDFGGTEKLGREITLEPTTGQAIWNYFRRLFDQKHAPVNINAASQAVLGSRDPYDVEQLQKTYGKNIKLVIRVSIDLESVYFETKR